MVNTLKKHVSFLLVYHKMHQNSYRQELTNPFTKWLPQGSDTHTHTHTSHITHHTTHTHTPTTRTHTPPTHTRHHHHHLLLLTSMMRVSPSWALQARSSSCSHSLSQRLHYTSSAHTPSVSITHHSSLSSPVLSQ